MKTFEFKIEGITCQGCVSTLETKLAGIKGVNEFSIAKDTGIVKYSADTKIPESLFESRLLDSKKYSLSKYSTEQAEVQENSFKPLAIILLFLIGMVAISQINQGYFKLHVALRYFMGGFFVIFAFFKVLDLKGFVTAYAGYDLITKRWKAWGYIYPFVELGLGVAFLLNAFPVVTNLITLIVMAISSIGVIRAVLLKKEIQCACLGTGFNLPMTTVTIIEDLGMMGMAAYMLIILL